MYNVYIFYERVMHMEHTSMNIRINKVVKQEAQQIFLDLGLDMTTAINIFLRQVIITRGIPFELKLNPIGNESAPKGEDEVT